MYKRQLLVLPYLSGFLVHRHAGEIPHVLVGAGQSIEQRSLAAVLVTRPVSYTHLDVYKRQALLSFVSIASAAVIAVLAVVTLVRMLMQRRAF